MTSDCQCTEIVYRNKILKILLDILARMTEESTSMNTKQDWQYTYKCNTEER